MSERNLSERDGAAAADGGQFAAQIGFGLARGFGVVAQLFDLVIALGQQRGPVRRAVISSSCTRLCNTSASVVCSSELPFEIGGALAETAELFAGRGQFRRRRFGLAALAIAALLDILHRAFVVGDADLHRLDLGAQRGELDALAVGGDRMLAQFGDQLGQLGLLVGERALGLAQRAGLELEFLLGGAQLLALASCRGPRARRSSRSFRRARS